MDCTIPRTLIGGKSYPSAEMQLAYSTAVADWASFFWGVGFRHKMKILNILEISPLNHIHLYSNFCANYFIDYHYLFIISNYSLPSKWPNTSSHTFGSNISSIESDINIHIRITWTTIDTLSITWKSHLSDKKKWEFIQAIAMSLLLYSCTTWTLIKLLKKKLDGNYTRILQAVLNKFWKHKTTAEWSLASHHTNHPSKMNKTCWAWLVK